MVTKNQLNKQAQKRYGVNYLDLSGSEKAIVSRDLGHVGGWAAATGNVPMSSPRASSRRQTNNVASGGGICKFLRFGSNGVKEVPFAEGATLREAYDQQKDSPGGIKIDETKEGFQDRVTGKTVLFNDRVEDGQTLVATLGITSN